MRPTIEPTFFRAKQVIRNKLSTDENPKKAILEIQQMFGLGFPSCSPGLVFLDVMNISRLSVYQNLLDSLKSTLDGKKFS